MLKGKRLSNHHHFKGKDPVNHVIETYAKGVITSTEVHGMETPGRISAFADAIRDCSIMLLLVWMLLYKLNLPLFQQIMWISIFGISLVIWKTTRSAWLGWARLERLHRVLLQEKWEIEHHREQEREELAVLYAAKGFHGQLLEDVLDVLMADGDRLLKVMLQEELGLSLEDHDHPLLQGLGAFVGSLAPTILVALSLWLSPLFGVIAICTLLLLAATAITTNANGNDLIPALIWSIGAAIITVSTFYLLSEYFITLKMATT